MAPLDAKSAAPTFAVSRTLSEVSWASSRGGGASPQREKKKGGAGASPSRLLSASSSSSPPLSPTSLAAFHSRFHGQVRSILRLFQKGKGARDRLEPAAGTKPLHAMEGDERSLHLSSKDSAASDSASESGDDLQLGWLNAYADSTFSESNWIRRDRSQRSLRSTAGGEGPAAAPSPPRQSVEELFDTAMRGSNKRSGNETSGNTNTNTNTFLSRKSPFLHYQKRQSSNNLCSFEEAVDAMKRQHKVRSINKWLDSSSHFLDAR